MLKLSLEGVSQIFKASCNGHKSLQMSWLGFFVAVVCVLPFCLFVWWGFGFSLFFLFVWFCLVCLFLAKWQGLSLTDQYRCDHRNLRKLH